MKVTPNPSSVLRPAADLSSTKGTFSGAGTVVELIFSGVCIVVKLELIAIKYNSSKDNNNIRLSTYKYLSLKVKIDKLTYRSANY